MMYHGLLQFAGREADWIRRAGVLIAIVGTAVAAPEGTAWLWRAAKALPQRGWSKVRPILARLFPGLRREVTGGATLRGRGGMNMSGRARASVDWSEDTPLEERINILRENLRLAEQEIDEVRREARQRIEEVRRAIEHRLGLVEAAQQAHQAAHAVTQRQAAGVDARGVVLIGLGVVMTGVPDGLARFGWFGWLFLVGALIAAVVIACQAVRTYLSLAG
jgi:ElaB/YqjD/DUF883 family membrane-anchored ribosome-binding protein